MAGHLGAERVTTQNLEVVQHRRRARPDPRRGRGSRRRRAAGSSSATRSSAPLPKDAPKPGKFRLPTQADAAAAPAAEAAGERVMKLEVTTLDGGAAGAVELVRRRSSASSRAQDILHRMRALAARQAPGRHAQDARAAPRSPAPARRSYKQKGTGGARHGSARAPQFRGGGKAFGPVVRSHATTCRRRSARSALKHALSAKAKRRRAHRARRGVDGRRQDQGAEGDASASSASPTR